MNAWQNKQTGEVREQQSSPGDDWQMIAPITWRESIAVWFLIVLCIGFLIWIK